MDPSIALRNSRRHLLQRNVMGAAVLVMAVISVAALASNTGREREIVLQPILGSELSISSAGASEQYLEMATRDAALLILNRSPENLENWRKSILKMADPRAHGQLNRDLGKIVQKQTNTDISQYFEPVQITVDADKLESTVSGHVNTVVGTTVTSTEFKRFQFTWTYSGLSLRLSGFGQIVRSEDGDGDE